MNAPRDRAVQLLVNYFDAIARKAGLRWDPDYTAEIGEAVDAIIEASTAGFATLRPRVVESCDLLRQVEQKLDREQAARVTMLARLEALEGRSPQ